MAQAKFSIGIDLGTSNSALAFSSLTGEGESKVLAIPQWDTASTVTESSTVPSFLYLAEEAVAAQIRGRGLSCGEWVVGRLARQKASETPGRDVHSAKSRLCHHAADRSAPFWPWGSDELMREEKISPVFASALILKHLRAAWNARLAEQDPGFQFDAQEITITVPASFDAAAQRLTLAAVQEAGFPDHTRLIEEPQAAFYRWLEQQEDRDNPLPDRENGVRHVLVIDVGGGTSDFSLFELSAPEGNRDPRISRVAVSDHILLGGDNVDLAIAHLVEPRLVTGEGRLSAVHWDHLVARCRSLKESVLGCEGAPDEVFTVSVPGRGSRLIAGSLSAQLTRMELDELVLNGFFPACRATDRPRRALGAVREWGLPYAFDSAVTRHLAEFLNGRPRVDAVLFNGGSLFPQRLRDRLRDQIGLWQEGCRPEVLENAELDLAVARGAAYFGKLKHFEVRRIEAGAARAVFLETHREAAHGKSGAEPKRRSLVCILPHGASSEQVFELSGLDLKLRINRPVRFQIHTSTRHGANKAGDVVDFDPELFHTLPPLETIATVAQPARGELPRTIPVALNAKVNELGLLQVSCRSLARGIRQSWPLEFALRPHESGGAAPAGETAPDRQAEASAAPDALTDAGERIKTAFTQPLAKRDKLTAARLFQSLEQSLGCSKGDWNGIVVRGLWTSLEARQESRAVSVDHEEAWLILAGFFLRPGFGVAMDESRIDALWRVCSAGLRFQGKRTKLQEYILWRRVAGGLSRERQESVLAEDIDKIREGKVCPPELIRMAGSFERLGHELKTELTGRFIEMAVDLMSQRKHCAPYLTALGLLLNRAPFYSGPESVAPPALVEQAYEALRAFDWKDPEFSEAQILFLRAARAVDDRRLDPPKSLRHQIAARLEKCGMSPVKTGRLRKAMPIERTERVSLFGEALPPGLILSG
ncbi:MAG: Hsp70 family protein [Rhodomicrobium sp.]